jgi:hypothetical protein
MEVAVKIMGLPRGPPEDPVNTGYQLTAEKRTGHRGRTTLLVSA